MRDCVLPALNQISWRISNYQNASGCIRVNRAWSLLAIFPNSILKKKDHSFIKPLWNTRTKFSKCTPSLVHDTSHIFKLCVKRAKIIKRCVLTRAINNRSQQKPLREAVISLAPCFTHGRTLFFLRILFFRPRLKILFFPANFRLKIFL